MHIVRVGEGSALLLNKDRKKGICNLNKIKQYNWAFFLGLLFKKASRLLT